ncbi:Mevalonate kinase [Basidiobolus ranarum]|uniref:Mevalonate kinase n=1 Tax=Basidiobolus ranarum TaxID=34480 RepID=A0ABR2X339_9FUNG
MTIGEEIVVAAPGKVILFGEHAVVYGKTAVAASVGLRCYLVGKKTSDDTITLCLPDLNVNYEWKIHDIPTEAFELVKKQASIDEVLVVLEPLATEYTSSQKTAILSFFYLYVSLVDKTASPYGLALCVRSTLPVGAGLGSSASYSVCIATCLLQFNGHISTLGGNPKLDTKTAETINKWAFQAEKVIHGNPSGIDNTVSTFGGAQMYTKGDIETLHKFKSLKFLLTNTKVPRDTRTLVANVRSMRDQYPLVVDHLMEAIHGISKSCQVVFDSSASNEEIMRSIEELIDLNHQLIAATGVSHPSLERIREITGAKGLHSKLTGAGGGGCALTLLRDDTPKYVLEAVEKELVDAGFECYETSIGVEGVKAMPLHRPEESLQHDLINYFMDIPKERLDQLLTIPYKL